MTRLTETIEVNASPRQLAEYLMDANNIANYFPASNVNVLESTPERARARHDLAVGGKTTNMVCVLEQTERGRKIRFHTEEGMRLEGTWLLQEIRGGTQVTCVLEYEPLGGFISRLLDGLTTKKQMQGICTGALKKLKELLEGGEKASEG